ncbi:MAG: hypothetical protein QM323_09100 [Acidobacteriota bacterium]|nr:hypothetical protein [Acidobacteriota bacterium]
MLVELSVMEQRCRTALRVVQDDWKVDETVGSSPHVTVVAEAEGRSGGTHAGHARCAFTGRPRAGRIVTAVADFDGATVSMNTGSSRPMNIEECRTTRISLGFS